EAGRAAMRAGASGPSSMTSTGSGRDCWAAARASSARTADTASASVPAGGWARPIAGTPNSTACCASRSSREPAARPTTRKASGCARITSRDWVPTEPVAPITLRSRTITVHDPRIPSSEFDPWRRCVVAPRGRRRRPPGRRREPLHMAVSKGSAQTPDQILQVDQIFEKEDLEWAGVVRSWLDEHVREQIGDWYLEGTIPARELA